MCSYKQTKSDVVRTAASKIISIYIRDYTGPDELLLMETAKGNALGQCGSWNEFERRLTSRLARMSIARIHEYERAQETMCEARQAPPPTDADALWSRPTSKRRDSYVSQPAFSFK